MFGPTDENRKSIISRHIPTITYSALNSDYTLEPIPINGTETTVVQLCVGFFEFYGVDRLIQALECGKSAVVFSIHK